MDTLRRVGAWLGRRAENVIAVLLAVMFAAFIIQIVFRYFLNLPTGWTTELTLTTWLWMVLWGSAFVLKDSEEIRFDLLTSASGDRARRAMGVLAAVGIIALYGLSLPATIKYVTFMKVEHSSYLHIRLDYLYSIFVLFIVATILRYAWRLWQLLRGSDPDLPGADPEGSAS
jgi:TRAP-type C4-dicarboxylate transport system permease small subunit